MNDNIHPSLQAMAAVERVQRLFAAQRAACLAQPCPSADERLERLRALKRQTQRYQGLLSEAMSTDFGFRPAAESKMLDLLGSVLGGMGGGGAGGAADGASILGHILGGNQQRAEAGLGQATGLGANAGQLLQILAPIVMAFLAQRAQAGGMDAGGLGAVLGREQAQVRQQGGVGGDLLGSLLDQDGDGQVGLGDLIKIGGGLLGGRR